MGAILREGVGMGVGGRGGNGGEWGGGLRDGGRKTGLQSKKGVSEVRFLISYLTPTIVSPCSYFCPWF